MDLQGRNEAVSLTESGQIASWLLKVAVGLLLTALVLVEAIGVLVAQLAVRDAATSAATAAALAVHGGATLEQVKREAQDTAESSGATLDSLTLDRQARVVIVHLTKLAPTHLIQRISFLRKFSVATATARQPYG